MAGLELDDVPEGDSGPHCYPKDVVNHLLLVWAIDYIEHSPTKFNNGSDPAKPCDVVVVDAVDLDMFGEDGAAGLICRRNWWRQGRLIQKLKGRIGNPKPLLVKMSMGVSSNGANRPFELLEMRGDTTAVARANLWWSTHTDFAPTAKFSPNSAAGAGSNASATLLPPPAPPAPPSPLEQQAKAAQGGAGESAVMQSLRLLGAQQLQDPGDPPF